MTVRLALAVLAALIVALPLARVRARRARRYVRLLVEPYRADRGRSDGLVTALDTFHKLLQRGGWRRLAAGQPSLALELRLAIDAGGAPRASLAIVVPADAAAVAEAALRGAYPNTIARVELPAPDVSGALLRLRKRRPFIERIAVVDADTLEHPPADRILTVMAAATAAAAGAPSPAAAGATAQSPGDCTALVQLALTPAPGWFERVARRMHERRERVRAREPRRPSQVAQVELEGGLDLQHRPLFFGDVRVAAPDRLTCERIAAELRSAGAENRLMPRTFVALRAGARARAVRGRVARGEGEPLPAVWRGVYASNELAALWQFPSVGFAGVPFARRALPVSPAPPAILRTSRNTALLCDDNGPVTLHPGLRRQNMAVVGTVEQGKTSLLVASARADLQRPECAVILLDPKGDAAEAVLSAVPEQRDCTLLDMRAPTCGFNPLAVDAPADAIADFVVAALRQLFGEGDIRGSSDRYLRNAIIAVLACDARASLWDVARLLSVGADGQAYREWVGTRLLENPQYSEVAAFFAGELTAQLADARAATTAKLDAPANKLARLLNSPSIKRVLLNESLRLDLDRIVERGEVLVVRGALGEIGATNVAVLMQLIVGALDAALARQQDRRDANERSAVALKIDEAPLVINDAFAQTLALKRSAGLETVASWQTDAQWPPELRNQLDALFAHRVYFATASAQDAREAAGALLDEYSDQLRPGAGHGLAAPDVRLHLPPHHAIASWVTPEGRQQPFIARTLRYGVDDERLAFHAARQRERGGRELESFERRHWARGAATRRAEVVQFGTEGDGSAPATAGHPDTYAELLALDAASRARVVPNPAKLASLFPDALDVELLAWLGTVGWALTTQIHRRFNSGKALTTTQRRLKRLADAGAVMRVQLHAPDGGGAPMCCALEESGRALLSDRKLPAPVVIPDDAPARGEALATMRDRLRLVGWMLALESRLGAELLSLRGPRRMRLAPPEHRGTAIGPAQLRLAAGMTPRDFVRRVDGADPVSRADPVSGVAPVSGAAAVSVDRFAAVTPLAAVEVRSVGSARTKVLVDSAATGDGAKLVAQLERYDHMLAGWWSQTHEDAPPRVVLICADAAAAERAALTGDAILVASHAYPGETPRAWPRPGRELIFFVAESDIHAGRLHAVRAPALPPGLRAAGDPSKPRTGDFVAATAVRDHDHDRNLDRDAEPGRQRVAWS